jgi:AcrR family transcriptional regulator
VPRSVDSDARRRELTDATARLIARAGIGAVSLRAVAAEAGWSTGALTHHFSGKSELLLATLTASLDRRRAQRARSEPGDAWGELRAGLAAVLPLDEDSRRHWMVTVAFCAESAGGVDLAQAQRDAYRQHRLNVAGLVNRALPDATDPDLVLARAEWLIALTDGVALQAVFDPESWPPDRQLESLEAALVVLGQDQQASSRTTADSSPRPSRPS